MRNTPIDAPQQAGAEQSAVIAAIRDQRIKGIQTEAAQGCAATQGGLIRPDEGGGNPEVDQAAASARGLENRPLIVLTAGRYWRPDDPVAAREIAEFHEVWVHQLQSDLANLYRTSGQASKSACWVHFREIVVIRPDERNAFRKTLADNAGRIREARVNVRVADDSPTSCRFWGSDSFRANE